MEENNKRKRVYFGSLEESNSIKNSQSFNSHMLSTEGITFESLNDIKYENELSTSGLKAKEEQAKLLKSFEDAKRRRSLVVPTDDARVRLKLKEFQVPQCLFGEGPGDRRARLRDLMARTGDFSSDSEDDKLEIQTDEFFSVGSISLLEMRRKIALFSLNKARTRIQNEMVQFKVPLAQRKTLKQVLNAYLKTYGGYSSQVGDDRPLSVISFSPDSTKLLTGSFSGCVKLWSVPTCEPVQGVPSYSGHSDRVTGVCFNPNDINLDDYSVKWASSSSDGSVSLWNYIQETPIASLIGHNLRVCKIEFHPFGSYLGTTSFDGTWRMWDIETTEELLLQEGHSREVFCLSFHPDGSLNATGGLDGIGRIWDLRTGRSIMVLKGHNKEILSIDFSPNGYQIATGSEDHTIRIWDVRTLKELNIIPAHLSIVSDVKFYHGSLTQTSKFVKEQINISGLYLSSCSFDGTLKIWSADDWRLVHSIKAHEGKVMSLDVAKDHRFIATAGYDRTFKLWASDEIPYRI